MLKKKKNLLREKLNDELSNSLELAVADFVFKLWCLEVTEHHCAWLDQATITFRHESLASAARNRKRLSVKTKKIPWKISKNKNIFRAMIGRQ